MDYGEAVYIPAKGDLVDYEIAKVVNANRYNITIPIAKLYKNYLIGT